MRRALLTAPGGGVAGTPGIATPGSLSTGADTVQMELGWAFSVNTATTVVALRAFPRYSGDVTVNLWNSGGTLLSSTVLSAAAAGVWSEGAIAPVALSSGATYVVSFSKAAGVVGYNTFAKASTVANPKISVVQGRFATTAGAYPTNTSSSVLYGVADVSIT